MENREKKICVILPTKNEEVTIKKIVEQIRETLSDLGFVSPVILITDDSNDGTRKTAKSIGVEIVNGGGRGLGFAMYKGLKACLKYNPDYIISMDSDGQSNCEEIKDFLTPLESGTADIVIGSRFLQDKHVNYHYKWKNRLGVIILSWILRRLTKQHITDSHGGIRAMNTEVVRELEMLGTHTYVQETIIDAVEKGFRIEEIPSEWNRREHGQSRVVSSIPTYIFYTLPILILRAKQHIKWVYSIGITLVSLAVIHFFYISWQAGFHFKAMFSRTPSFILISVLILTGVQFFFFGFILQLMTDIKYRVDRVDR